MIRLHVHTLEAACLLALILPATPGCGSAPLAPAPPHAEDPRPVEDRAASGGDAAVAGDRQPESDRAGAQGPVADPGAGAPEPQSPDLQSPDSESIVLALVNGAPLTLDEALVAFEAQHVGHSSLVKGTAELRQLVGRLIEQRLLLAEAEALGLPDSEELLETTELRRETLAEALFWQRAVDERVAVPDEDVEAYYAKTDVALRLTLIETADLPTAEALHARVTAGEDMGALARESSIHESGAFNGSVPIVRHGELDMAMNELAFALQEPGDLTSVVATESGFAFARLEERFANPNRPEREAALPQIRSVLEDNARKALRAETEARLEAEAEIVITGELLAQEILLETSSPDAVVARSAGETLLLQEFRDILNLEAIRAADAEQVAESVEAIVRDWAMRLAVHQAPEYASCLEDPGVVEKTEAFKHRGALGLLFDQYIYVGIEPSEEELLAHYEENLEARFTRPPEVRVAYLVVATDTEARDVLRRIEAGERFRDLAQEVSLDPQSRVHGGRIGWVRQGQMLPEVEEVLFKMEVDAIEGPIATEAGQFVVTILDRKPPQILPFQQARPSALKGMLETRKQEAHTAWATKLRERADVEILDEGLASAVEWLEANAPEESSDTPAAGSPHGPGPPPPTDLPDLPENAENAESTLSTAGDDAR